ncbi:MAG: prepilin-type N-terminal cleavage/methylation domain-containing protein [Gemmatimonadota bacterium]|jgi:prepilin-type N-terminal cleavage/methylation domain-containing protein
MNAARGRSGFSLVELLIVLLIIGILASLAIPTYHSMVIRARAAQVAGDLNTIKVAAYNYDADHHEWPPETAAGQVPAGLAPYLPENFSFVRDDYELDWEYWVLSGTSTSGGTRVGASVVTDDTRLGAAIVRLLGGIPHIIIGNRYTFIFQNP